MEPASLAYYASDFGPEFEQAARILAADFERLGLAIELQPTQQGAFVDTITVGGQLEDIALGSWGGDPDRIDPNHWLVDLSTCDSQRNAPKWCDPQYDEIAMAQAAEMDPQQRLELVHQAQEYFHEALPWWLVASDYNGILYNSERWENVVSPEPMSPSESQIHPWLSMRPVGDDRILDIAHYEDVSSYNPFAETGAHGWLRLIYDTFTRDEQGQIVPWAAESWEVIDETTVELTLRDGMQFHDGTPVTAEDAVFSINYMLEWQPAPFAVALQSIDSAELVDDLTLRINLTQPDAAFERTALAFLVILPQHIWEGVPESVGVSDPSEWDPTADDAVIGSGPFVFERWDRNQQHVVSANRDHWRAPQYDGIRKLALGQTDAVSAALVSGDADLAAAVVPVAEMVRLAEQEAALEHIVVPTHSSTALWVNHEKEPYSDPAFRRALLMATNREQIAAEAWLGYADPAGAGPIPPILDEWYHPGLEEIPYDIEGAREVLAEAGYDWDSEGRLLLPAADG